MKTTTKDSFREIMKSKSRFFSILLIVFLGTATFVGLKSLVNDIDINFNKKINEYNMYDIRIDSPFGFDDEDKKLINSLPGLESVNIYNETLDSDKKILYIQNKNLNNNVAVSLVNTPNSRILPGYTVIGNGIDVSYLQNTIYKNGILIEKAYFVNNDKDLDNVAILKFKELKGLNIFSKDYAKITKMLKDEIARKFNERAKVRKEEILAKLDDSSIKISEGKKKIEDSVVEIENNKKLLAEKQKELDAKKKEFLNAPNVIKKYQDKLKKKKNELVSKKETLEDNLSKVNSGLDKINSNMPQITAGLKELDDNEAKLKENEEKLEKRKGSIFLSDAKYKEYKAQIEAGKKTIADKRAEINKTLDTKKSLEDNKAKLESGISQIEAGIVKINSNYNKLLEQEKEYNQNYQANLRKFEDGQKKIDNGYTEIKDANEKIENSREELKANSEKINEASKNINMQIYKVGSRFDNMSFLSLYNNMYSMNIISLIFSSLFFLITIFIVTTTIVRFSFEQRGIIGTYKFLGYSNKSIVGKFYLYGLTPSIIGMILGSFFGTYIIPRMIYPSLVLEFIQPLREFTTHYDFISILEACGLLLIIIVITIALILRGILKEKVIDLLLNIQVKQKKKIHIKNIMLRNIFKYKLRLLMTVFGITLCTSLIYLGVSLRYSVKDIGYYQKSRVKKVDATIILRPNISQKLVDNYIDEISKKVYLYKENISQISVVKNNKDYNVQKVYLLDNNYKKFLNIDLKLGEVALSQKTADILGVDPNKPFTYYDSYNLPHTISANYIFENYVSQYIYIRSNDEPVNALTVIFKNPKDLEKADEILGNKKVVYSINYERDNEKALQKQTSSINYVIIFMIALGASLAIIVTYNLGNINILERRRELSTLEVLGFRFMELREYIFREILALAVFSIILGIFCGRGLQKLVAIQFRNTPIQLVMTLNPIAIVSSFVLSLVFVLLVFIILSAKMSKIEMVESLKVSD